MSGLEIGLIAFASIFFLYEITSLVIQIVKRIKEKKEKSNEEVLANDDPNRNS